MSLVGKPSDDPAVVRLSRFDRGRALLHWHDLAPLNKAIL